MKLLKMLLTGLFISTASGLMAQQGFQIDLKLNGFKPASKFYLVDLDHGNKIDSGILKNGKITFKGRVKTPITGRIHVDDEFLVVYLENKPIKIEGDFKNFQYAAITGTMVNTQATKSRDAQRKFDEERSMLMNQYIQLDSTTQYKAKGILSRVKKIDSTVLQQRLSFIKTEAPSYFTIQELFFIRNDMKRDELATLFSKFPDALKKSKQGAIVELYIKNKKPDIGSKFIDIRGVDVNGKPHKLSDMKAKYILLDFWASWCGPCRTENPLLVKVYNTYKTKGFEIFGFSTDANKENWLTAINQDQLPWLNVSDLLGFYSKGPAAYEVRAIPQNFLIDENGIIIAKNLRGKELEQKLESLFKVKNSR